MCSLLSLGQHSSACPGEPGAGGEIAPIGEEGAQESQEYEGASRTQ